ncbi:MAG: D-glycero-beta-D-manno-heptose 1,7-bisphosphate 7-phosphatase [Mariprofundaceae bacterium]|nr:D-glycero-beta-D-manno-heptose 1,7-bisphosphate 7-phosphatase [Mariprofundaceae bacterium]
MTTTILLDRDGVINFDSPYYILSPKDWQPIPGSLEAIAALTKSGIKIGLCSNQSALGRGMFQAEEMQAIHQKMMQAIDDTGGHIAHSAYCPHHPDAQCLCRKPKAGLLIETLTKLHSEAHDAFMIGDSLRDVQAALAANVEPILVQTGYGDAKDIAEKAQHIYPHIGIYPDLKSAIIALKLTSLSA